MNVAHPLEGAHNECMQAYEASKKLRQSGRKIFSVQLRDTRTQLGMTCRQLGSAIGVTGQLISQIETTAKSILSRDDYPVLFCHRQAMLPLKLISAALKTSKQFI
jgi:DNA-binding XRE family transcriptional regulator